MNEQKNEANNTIAHELNNNAVHQCSTPYNNCSFGLNPSQKRRRSFSLRDNKDDNVQNCTSSPLSSIESVYDFIDEYRYCRVPLESQRYGNREAGSGFKKSFDEISAPTPSFPKPSANYTSFSWISWLLALKKKCEVNKRRRTEALKLFFGWWSDLMYHYPYWSIGTTIFVTIILGTGLIPGYPHWIEGAEKLYTLQKSLARDHAALYSLLFGESRTRFSYVMISTDDEWEKQLPSYTNQMNNNEYLRLQQQQLPRTESYENARHHLESESLDTNNSLSYRNIEISDDENILTWKYLKIITQIDSIIRGKSLDPLQGIQVAIPHPDNDSNETNSQLSTTEEFEFDGSTYVHARIDAMRKLRYEDLCRRNPQGACEGSTVFNLIMNALPTSVRLQTSISPTGDSNIKPELWIVDGFLIDIAKQGFLPADVYLGSIFTQPCIRPVPSNFLNEIAKRIIPKSMLNMTKLDLDLERSQINLLCVKGAKALLLSYGLRDGHEYQLLNEQWESVFLAVMRSLRNYWPGLHIYVNAFRSRDDELKSSTSQSNDSIFIGLTFVMLVGYSAMTNFSCDLYQAKPFSAVAGTFAAILGLISGIGFCCHLGLSLVPTALVCPFLILGIGVDDMCVILNGYSLAFNFALTPQERCRSSLKGAGISITLTTVTSMISFIIGSWSPYLAIRNFCVLCGAGLFFGYIFVFTFFFPMLCLDAQRESQQRLCFWYDRNKSQNIKKSPSALSTGATITSVKNNMTPSNATQQGDNLIFLIISQMAQHYMSQGSTNASSQKESRSSESLSQNSQQLNMLQITNDQVGEPERTTNVSVKTRAKISDKSDVESPICCLPTFNTNETNNDLLTVEPWGNVGRRSRLFLLRYYGPILTKGWIKALVILLFCSLLGFCAYGFSHLRLGLDLQDLAPRHSYLRAFDDQLQKHFNTYDLPCDVFFSTEKTPWWSSGFLDSMKSLEEDLVVNGVAVRIINPLHLVVGDPRYRTWMLSGDKETFEAALYSAVTDPSSRYFSFQNAFLWQGRELRAWKMTILPPFMTTSQQRASWMVHIRRVCRRHGTFKIRDNIGDQNNIKEEASGLNYQYFRTSIIPWNFMMIFYESDLRILYFVVTEMTTAGITLSTVAMWGLPDWKSGAIVTSVMAMIDLTIFGCMYYWNIKLNMISMVNLLISIGFAVDYSTHIAHTFLECIGPTRDSRTIESLVVMGNPIFHGAIASLLGISMLGFSESHIFQIFFKMMTLIVVFGLAYGIVFLPVVLSIVGTLVEHSLNHCKPSSSGVETPVAATPVQTHSLFKSKSLTFNRKYRNHESPEIHTTARRSCSSSLRNNTTNFPQPDYSIQNVQSNQRTSPSEFYSKSTHFPKRQPSSCYSNEVRRYGQIHEVSEEDLTVCKNAGTSVYNTPCSRGFCPCNQSNLQPWMSVPHHMRMPLSDVTPRRVNRNVNVRTPNAGITLTLPGVTTRKQTGVYWTPVVKHLNPKSTYETSDTSRITFSTGKLLNYDKNQRNHNHSGLHNNRNEAQISPYECYTASFSCSEDEGDTDSPAPQSTDRQHSAQRDRIISKESRLHRAISRQECKTTQASSSLVIHPEHHVPIHSQSSIGTVQYSYSDEYTNDDDHIRRAVSFSYTTISEDDHIESHDELTAVDPPMLNLLSMKETSNAEWLKKEKISEGLQRNNNDGVSPTISTSHNDSETQNVPRNILAFPQEISFVPTCQKRSLMTQTYPRAVRGSSLNKTLRGGTLPSRSLLTSLSHASRQQPIFDYSTTSYQIFDKEKDSNDNEKAILSSLSTKGGLSELNNSNYPTPTNLNNTTIIEMLPDNDSQFTQWSTPPLLTKEPLRSLPLPKRMPQRTQLTGLPILRENIKSTDYPISRPQLGRLAPPNVRGKETRRKTHYSPSNEWRQTK